MPGPRPSNQPLPAVPTSWSFAVWYQWALGVIAFLQQFVFDTDPPGPIPSASATPNNLAIILSWEPARKASGYHIYRGTTGNFNAPTTSLKAEVPASQSKVASYTWQDSADSTQAARFYWIVPVNVQNGKEGPKSAMLTVTNFATNTGTAVGTNAVANGSNTVAVGKDAEASGNESIAIGIGTRVSGSQSIGIGENVIVTHDNAIVIGDAQSSTDDDQIIIATDANTALRIDADGNVFVNGVEVGELITVNTAEAATVAITPSNTSGTWSAWTEVFASIATRALRLMFTIIPSRTNNSNTYIEFELASGGAGAEVNIFDGHSFAAAAETPQSAPVNFVTDMDIAAGTRIAVRVRQVGASSVSSATTFGVVMLEVT